MIHVYISRLDLLYFQFKRRYKYKKKRIIITLPLRPKSLPPITYFLQQTNKIQDLRIPYSAITSSVQFGDTSGGRVQGRALLPCLGLCWRHSIGVAGRFVEPLGLFLDAWLCDLTKLSDSLTRVLEFKGMLEQLILFGSVSHYCALSCLSSFGSQILILEILLVVCDRLALWATPSTISTLPKRLVFVNILFEIYTDNLLRKSYSILSDYKNTK